MDLVQRVLEKLQEEFWEGEQTRRHFMEPDPYTYCREEPPKSRNLCQRLKYIMEVQLCFFYVEENHNHKL